MSPDGSVTVDPATINATNGSTVSFNCLTTAGGGNSFMWIGEDSSELSAGGSVTIIANSSQSTLTVTGVNASQHGGEYACVVSNAAGNGSDTGTLNVAPVIIVQPVPTLPTSSGHTAVLNCVAQSFPSPVYHWEKLTNNQLSTVSNSNSSILVFNPVMFGNEGLYQCVAESLAGVVKSSLSTVVGEHHSLPFSSS